MNIPKLITALVDSGVNQGQIAAKCGCSQSQISKIWHGIQEPRLSVALAIETLHAKTCKPKRRATA